MLKTAAALKCSTKEQLPVPIVEHPLKSLFKKKQQGNAISKRATQWRNQRVFDASIPVKVRNYVPKLMKNS